MTFCSADEVMSPVVFYVHHTGSINIIIIIDMVQKKPMLWS